MSRTIREQMQADLVTALKAGDVNAVSVLRTTLAALANAEAVDPGAPLVRAGLFGDVERRRLAADDVTAIVAAELAELSAAASVLDEAGQTAEADACRTRATILERYLAASPSRVLACENVDPRRSP